MSYKPTDTLKDSEVFREFQAVASELQELRRMLVTFREPYKPRDGQFLIADGTSWDPMGDGLKMPIWYDKDAGVWKNFGTGGGGGGAVDSVNGETGAVVLTLDDLDDVDAAAPNDLDVLSFDAGSGKWIPVAPGSPGSIALDDLTDVDTSGGVTDQDILVYDSGSGNWLPTTQPTESAMVKLGSITVSSGVSTVSFNSISSSYSSLKIIFSINSATQFDSLYMEFNGDTGANYDTSIAYNGTSGGGAAHLNAAKSEIASMPGSALSANQRSVGEITIPFYSDATGYKGSSIQTFRRDGAEMYTTTYNHNWHNTAAITDIVLGFASGNNFVVGSRFDLYGIR